MPDVKAAARYRWVSTVMATIALAAAIVALYAAAHVGGSQARSCERGNQIRSQLRFVIQTELLALIPAATKSSDPELRAELAKLIPRLSAALASEDLRKRDC